MPLNLFRSSSEAKTIISPFREVRNYEPSEGLDDCYFYQTMDLPGHGVVRGHWDLRGCEDGYLGLEDFSGMTMFDCGTASGHLTFEMERRGAKVTALDLDPDQTPAMGLVPFYDYEQIVGGTFDAAVERRRVGQIKLRNSFLHARRALGSKARLLIGDIVNSPIDEMADGALFGAILLHLRDPVGALFNVTRSVRHTIIVTDTYEGDAEINARAQPIFRPHVGDPNNVGTWFYLPPLFLQTLLTIAGFRHFETTMVRFKNDLNGEMVDGYNLVARR